MNRKNTRNSAILAIILHSLLIVATVFVSIMIVVYGLFLKGTPKGDESVLLEIFEVLQFYTILIMIVMVGFFIFMISYSLKIYRLDTLSPLEYKLKDALIKIFNILNGFCVGVMTILMLMLCFAGAFNSALLSVIIIFLGLCFILAFVSIYLIKCDTLVNNREVKRDTVSNIKTGNFNQKYGLGEYANKQQPTNNTKK